MKYLNRHEVGALIGMDGQTITIYMQRYADSPTPFPAPDIRLGITPGWSADRADEIRAWARNRPGRWGKKTADG